MEIFDFAVLGTGVIESIVAGALARAGKTVCHLDRNDFYGSQGASLPLSEYLHVLLNDLHYKNVIIEVEEDTALKSDGDEGHQQRLAATLPELLSDSRINQLFGALTSSAPVETLRKASQLLSLLKQSRKFSLDLSPKLLYCSGDVVKVLIRSNIGHYLEFRCVEKISMLWENKLELVPGSKEDVFKSDSLTLIEKRRLMKFLSLSIDGEKKDSIVDGASEGVLFGDFLSETGLSDRLKSVIFNAIGLFSKAEDLKSVTVPDGLAAIKKYMDSLGRYGDTGFLCGIYGTTSELSQAFCRFCAVYGGEYRLSFSISNIFAASDKMSFNISGEDGSLIHATKIVSSYDFLDKLPLSSPTLNLRRRRISRALVITSQRLPISGSLALVVVPPSQTSTKLHGVYAIQQNHETQACPEGLFVLSLLADSEGESAKDDLGGIVDKLLSLGQADGLLMKLFYQQEVAVSASPQESFDDDSIGLCPSIDSSIVTEEVVDLAESIFTRMCPGLEFLPFGLPQSEDD